jgi:2-oxo-4-hydroxy-4-carboxy-5-ureidoimidazoline decarboxylase
MSGAVAGLAALNGWPASQARSRLRACCAAPGWADRVTAARPYRDPAALHAAADAALAGAGWPDIAAALAAHPRIGDRPAGGGVESAWSRGEQRGAATADEATRAALATGNAEYERRFGHVFLICATGRTAADIHAELRRRLTNDPDTERATVRTELTKIVHLRLDKLLTDAAATNTDADATPRGVCRRWGCGCGWSGGAVAGGWRVGVG